MCPKFVKSRSGGTSGHPEVVKSLLGVEAVWVYCVVSPGPDPIDEARKVG